jgi:dTDP-4-amino-4,6-dideoxygalactose transaminase
MPAGRNTVLVPAFHCPNVVDPVVHAGFDVRFYAVDERLRVDAEDFLRKLDGKIAAAIFIQYFGFPCMPAELVMACRQAGATIIEDCSHSFLQASPLRIACSGADATTFSFWKLLPGGVGGGLLLGDADRETSPLRLSPPCIGDSLRRSNIALRQLLEDEIEVASRIRGRVRARPRQEPEPTPAVRRPAAEAYPYDPEASSWGMPRLMNRVLKCSDLSAVVTARRRNYQGYLSGLVPSSEMSPAFPDLPADVCPWGFPVILDRRGERDYLIRAAGVPLFTFGEVLHPLLFDHHAREAEMLDRARYLSDRLLAFSIHQGLEAAAVWRFAEVVNGFVGAS